MQQVTDYDNGRASKGHDCVEIGAEHGWNFGDENIAHHAAPDSRQHTEESPIELIST